MNKTAKLIFLILLFFSCTKKEGLIKEGEKTEKTVVPSETVISYRDYSNIFYTNFLLFISNKSPINIQKNYLEALSNEFDTLSLYRKSKLDKAFSIYTAIMTNLKDEEEIAFINQRAGISLFKKGDFDSSFIILTNVIRLLETKKIKNDELYYYLALNYIYKNDLSTAFKFIKLSKPSILTLDSIAFNYLSAKIALWISNTNEAISYLNKAVNIDRKQFEDRYGEEALVVFKNIYKQGNAEIVKENFKISFDLPVIYNQNKNIEYFYEMPPIVSRPIISRFRTYITNVVSLQNKFYCFYEDFYFKNETNSYLLLTSIPIKNTTQIKGFQIKEIFFASSPFIITFDIVKRTVVETNIVSNMIFTNNIELTNSQRINLPFNYLWKIEKVEYNNDEYWDYLIIGLNKTNEIVYTMFDPAANKLSFIKTNHIKNYSSYLFISDKNVKLYE